MRIPDGVVPDDLLGAIEIIYNDTVRTATERLVEYERLFPPADQDSLDFLFFFQPTDVPPGEDPSWGLVAELKAHRNLFTAQDNHQVYSIELEIIHLPPEPLEFPEPGQETWVRLFATHVMLRLMFNAENGVLVDGGQADFVMAPMGARWHLVEWYDLPRPGAATTDPEYEAQSWGSIKRAYAD